MATSAVSTSSLSGLLERSDELGALTGHLEQVAASQCGRMCLIGGEAGVGKTALVRRFLNQTAAGLIVGGACDPLFTARPLGPFADIAEAVGGRLAELIRGHARPHEVATALLALLRNSPRAIAVLEDLHWADEATLDVMRLLGRRIESAPGLVIATYRDDELNRHHPLRVLLGEMPHHESVARITLKPLSPSAVAILAQPHGVDADELYRKTSGNPFFVTEVLASAGEEIPSTLRDAVLARASRLSPRARTMLDAVAVVPHQTELWLLEAVSEESFGALGECLTSGMLARQDGAVGFRHELGRLAVEESIPPDRTLHLHRKTLRALAAAAHGSVDPARLAHHAERANDTEALLHFAHEAGERAVALGAHREAAAQFSRALQVAASLPALEHAKLLQDFAQECLHMSRADQAIDAQEKANELLREAGATVRQADGLRRLSRLYLCGLRGAEAERPIRQAIALLEQGPPTRELALAYSGLVMFHMNHDQAKATIPAAQRALELAEQLGDDETLLATLNSLGSMELMMGDPGGREKLLRSLEMADELGMDEHVGRAFLNLAGVMAGVRMYDGLFELISRGIEYCFQHGLELWRMWLLTSEAQALLDRGDWSRAAEVAGTVLRGERGQLPRINALPVVALVRARRGDPDVWPLLDEAKAMAEREGELQKDVPVALARAEAAWLEGRADAVRDETEAAFRKAESLEAWWQMGELTCWRRRAGIQDEVHPKLAERYRAELEGDLARAADLWTALGCEYDAALALAGADDSHLLRQSLVKLQRLGARAAAGIVARKLRAQGAAAISRGPRPTTLRNPAGLTGRELEVIELIGAGMRNAEIAKRLFVAPKTVDHHVSAILRKLAVDSRAEAARKAAGFGLLG